MCFKYWQMILNYVIICWVRANGTSLLRMITSVQLILANKVYHTITKTTYRTNSYALPNVNTMRKSTSFVILLTFDVRTFPNSAVITGDQSNVQISFRLTGISLNILPILANVLHKDPANIYLTSKPHSRTYFSTNSLSYTKMETCLVIYS